MKGIIPYQFMYEFLKMYVLLSKLHHCLIVIDGTLLDSENFS